MYTYHTSISFYWNVNKHHKLLALNSPLLPIVETFFCLSPDLIQQK